MFFWLILLPPGARSLGPQSIQTDPMPTVMINCQYITDEKAGNFFSFTLCGEPWSLYSVQRSTDLVTWDDFNLIPLYSSRRATVGSVVDNPTEIKHPKQFQYYRAVKIGEYIQYP